MTTVTREYDTKTDAKRRITLRDLPHQHYHVAICSNGRIALKPRVLAKAFEISEKTMLVTPE